MTHASRDAHGTSEQGSWEWLLRLRLRLGLVVELVDRQSGFVLPPVPTEIGRRVRHVLSESHHEVFAQALAHSTVSGTLEFARIADLRLGLYPFDVPQDHRQLVLVLAESAQQRLDADRRREWDRTVQWLSRTIAAQRSAAEDAGWDLRQLSTLDRLFTQARAKGSQRDVILTIVDALAVWHDMDVRAYVQDLTGRFVRDVVLAGADESLAPAVLESDPLPLNAPSGWLLDPQTGRWGFRAEERVLLIRAQGKTTAPWLLAVLGAHQHDELRFRAVSEMLVSALQSAAEIESSRLVWALTQTLVRNEDAVVRAAAAARVLADATLADVDWTIQRADGATVLRIGGAQASDERSKVAESATRLRFEHELLSVYGSTVTMRRPPDQPFTKCERALGGVAASLLRSWAAASLSSGELAGDQRALRGTFDEWLDRQSRARVDDGDVSLLVIRTDVGAQQRESGRGWVGEIRKELRPFDVAGRLTTGEIAVLLPYTGANQADAVVQRLRRSFRERTELLPLEAAPIGVASRHGTADVEMSLVNEARQRAFEAAQF